ncbi:MAG: hypothetical protein GEV07_14350 [Streptosporangiales bacterium]|nr:hypothetical protein [Streptosporangiales bacterium]
MASKKNQKRQAREQLAAQLAERARKRRRARVALFGAAGLVVVLLVAVVTWATVFRDDEAAVADGLPTPMASVGTGQPPWPLPPDPLSAARAAGLDVSEMEGLAKHFHAHLDILVDGEPLQVPGNIGVSSTAMSELHTHDAGGLIHIEAPTVGKRYILGQLFRTWEVRLDDGGIGGLEVSGDKTLRAYVNGKQVKGNPAAIELKPRRQIVLVYGAADAEVRLPTYTFAPDE